MKNKRETKKEMEQRIRNEFKEEQSKENYYEAKKRSAVIWTGIIGAIIGMIFLIKSTYVFSKVYVYFRRRSLDPQQSTESGSV